jgi:preprotein translocase SecE subunit
VLAFFSFGLVLWITVSKFLSTIMDWIGVGEYDFALLGERFTLTTMVGMLTALILGIWAYRHPTVSTLSGEVVMELKKVTWPSALETRSATVVVIITVFIMAFFLGFFDFFWAKVLSLIYPRIHAG